MDLDLALLYEEQDKWETALFFARNAAQYQIALEKLDLIDNQINELEKKE